MAIDTGVEIEACFFRRYMTVGVMKSLLSGLEDEDRLSPNRVGNLSIFRDRERMLIGFVDFNAEKLDLIERQE